MENSFLSDPKKRDQEPEGSFEKRITGFFDGIFLKAQSSKPEKR